MRGSHSDPQTPKLPQTQRPALSRVGVYRLNDSKAEGGLTPQNRKQQNQVTTGKQEIIREVKSMLIFTVVLKTLNSLNTDASESLLGGEEARAFGKKNNSTAVTIIFT